MPLAASPGFDDLGSDDIHQNLGERSSFRIPLEVVGGLIPRKRRIQHHRQKEVIPVVDDNQLATGALYGRVVDQVLLRAVRADVAFQRELTRDDFFDGNLLVPAVTAVAFFAARLGDFLGAAALVAGACAGFD